MWMTSHNLWRILAFLVVVILLLGLSNPLRNFLNSRSAVVDEGNDLPYLGKGGSKYVISQEYLEVPSDLSDCAVRLKRIYHAIQEYRRYNHELPYWLSDLVPMYLTESMLLCPITLERQSIFYPDPSLPCSFSYEFCPILYGWDPLQQVNPRQWKLQQLDEFGDVVPIVRCHCHRTRVLNLSVTGRVYLTGTNWESTFRPEYR